jgi:transposase
MNEADSIRLEQFRQLKKGIRGSKEHLVVGIDVAKERHRAFFGTATGKTLLKRLVFENTIEGFERLLIQTEALKAQHALTKTVFGLEPTANYHKPLGEFLIKGAHQVVLVSGVAVKRNRELLDGRWDKHDTKDSANVADLISQGKCLFFEYPPLALRELRSLLSLKRRLKKQEHGLKVRIRNHLLAQYFPELDRYFARSGSVGLEIVKWCLAPSVIAGLDYEQFAHRIAPGRKNGGQHKRLEAVWKMAVDSIGCDAGEAVAFEAKVLVEGLEQIREVLRAINSKIEDICLQFPEYRYLLPGFGPDVSSKTLAAIGNPFRFTTRGQVLKMAGLDLSANRSGNRSDAATPVLSKKGKADLRYALYQAGFVASSRNRHVIAYYTNKLRGREQEKGITTKMRVKLAAKLLVIAWTLMKKKESFSADYLGIE